MKYYFKDLRLGKEYDNRFGEKRYDYDKQVFYIELDPNEDQANADRISEYYTLSQPDNGKIEILGLKNQLTPIKTPIDNASSKNIFSIGIKILGVIVMIAAFIFPIIYINSMSSYLNTTESAATFFGIWIGGSVLGFVTMAFGEIISLLQDIKNNTQ